MLLACCLSHIEAFQSVPWVKAIIPGLKSWRATRSMIATLLMDGILTIVTKKTRKSRITFPPGAFLSLYVVVVLVRVRPLTGAWIDFPVPADLPKMPADLANSANF